MTKVGKVRLPLPLASCGLIVNPNATISFHGLFVVATKSTLSFIEGEGTHLKCHVLPAHESLMGKLFSPFFLWQMEFRKQT